MSCADASGPASVSSTYAVGSRSPATPRLPRLRLDGAFATYLGWLITWGTPVTLLGETADDIAEADTSASWSGSASQPSGAGHLCSRGRDRRGAGVVPDRHVANLEQVRRHRAGVILDVRRAYKHAEIHELPRSVDEVPDGEV